MRFKKFEGRELSCWVSTDRVANKRPNIVDPHHNLWLLAHLAFTVPDPEPLELCCAPFELSAILTLRLELRQVFTCFEGVDANLTLAEHVDRHSSSPEKFVRSASRRA